MNDMTSTFWPRTTAFLIAQATLPALAFLHPQEGPSWLWLAFLGAIAGQVTLMSTFAAMALWRESTWRLPAMMFLLVLLWFLSVLWLRVADSWFIPQIAMTMATMALIVCVVVFIVVRLGSCVFRWRIALVDKSSGEAIATR